MARSSMPGSACERGRVDFGFAVGAGRTIGRSSSEQWEIGELWGDTATRFDPHVDIRDLAGAGVAFPGDELADLRIVRKDHARQRVAEGADDFVDVGRPDVVNDPSRQ